MKNVLAEILNKDLSKIQIKDNSPSLYEDFPNKEKIIEITELRVLQIILSRRALIEKSGLLGEQIRSGEYLLDDKGTSEWIIYKLNDGTNRIGVFWSHFDDDSWSIFFKGDNLELDYLYYEN